ncbi:hypothetical protein PIB30_054074, partial [Stylosanthes scabra]|nr:hypothetical protein [Stylosanthes scabra]
YRVTVCVSDETSQGIFVIFDREAAHLLGKSCDALFKEVQMDAALISGDNYPLIFKDLVTRKILLKVDGLKDEADKYFGNYRVRRLCDDDRLIKLFDASSNGDALVTPDEAVVCEVVKAGESSGQNLKAPTITDKRPVKRSLIVEFDSEDDDDFVPAYKAHKAGDE